MRTLVTILAILVILETSRGQFFPQLPPPFPLVSPSAPRVWYPIFSPGGVSLRENPDTCPDVMLEAAKRYERAGTILTQFKRIKNLLRITNEKKVKATTMFDEGLSELMFWTEKGAKCANGKYQGTSLNILKNCSTTAMNSCDTGSENISFDPVNDGFADCQYYAYEIVDQYTVSIFQTNKLKCQFFHLTKQNYEPNLKSV